MISKNYCNHFILFILDDILKKRHTKVYTDTFIVDLSYMQSIKQLRDGSSVSGLYKLSLYLFG
jgi:hypothetical protein